MYMNYRSIGFKHILPITIRYSFMMIEDTRAINLLNFIHFLYNLDSCEPLSSEKLKSHNLRFETVFNITILKYCINSQIVLQNIDSA